MFKKIFYKNPNKLTLNPHHVRQPESSTSLPDRVSRAIKGSTDPTSQAMKIIHAGGHSEKYYMAIPAARIIEKYPTFVLAQPEVFHRPWDTIIRPEEILVPGHKYYVIPCNTLKKLRRRIRKSNIGPTNLKSFVENKNSTSNSGILVKPGLRVKARNLHVRFFGIDTTNKKPDSGSVDKRNDDKAQKGSNGKLKIPQIDQKKRRTRIEYTWEPSLNSIQEHVNE